MKKTIVWIAVTFFLLLIIGIILYSLLVTNKSEINEYEIKENFKDVKIITDTADIDFVLSENLNTLIICEEHKNIKHSVNVKENTLLVEVNDNRKWYEHIGISTSKITVYLPKSEYGELIMESDTGNVNIENIKANKFDLSTSTGNLKIVNTKCKNLFSETDTGNILLENVIASEKFKIETDTGNVKFKDSDASDIFVKTDTGNVTGNLLTDKVIFAESDTGNIDVPKLMTDEKCEIITDTGDIKITIY